MAVGQFAHRFRWGSGARAKQAAHRPREEKGGRARGGGGRDGLLVFLVLVFFVFLLLVFLVFLVFLLLLLQSRRRDESARRREPARNLKHQPHSMYRAFQTFPECFVCNSIERTLLLHTLGCLPAPLVIRVRRDPAQVMRSVVLDYKKRHAVPTVKQRTGAAETFLSLCFLSFFSLRSPMMPESSSRAPFPALKHGARSTRK